MQQLQGFCVVLGFVLLLLAVGFGIIAPGAIAPAGYAVAGGLCLLAAALCRQPGPPPAP